MSYVDYAFAAQFTVAACVVPGLAMRFRAGQTGVTS